MTIMENRTEKENPKRDSRIRLSGRKPETGYMATSSVFLIPISSEELDSRTNPQIWGRGSAMTFSLRKEVIQPQVLLRLPCYDFTPIMSCTLSGCLLAVSTPISSTAHFRDVTGG